MSETKLTEIENVIELIYNEHIMTYHDLVSTVLENHREYAETVLVTHKDVFIAYIFSLQMNEEIEHINTCIDELPGVIDEIVSLSVNPIEQKIERYGDNIVHSLHPDLDIY